MDRVNGILSFLILLASMFAACNGAAKEKSESSGAEMPQENQKSDSLLYVDLDLSQLSNLKQGDSYKLKTEQGEVYVLKIRRVDEPLPGIITISANVEDKETGLASFVLQENKLSGGIDMYQQKKRFQFGYDSLKARYFLKEVEGEQDILEGKEPLVPPRD